MTCFVAMKSVNPPVIQSTETSLPSPKSPQPAEKLRLWWCNLFPFSNLRTNGFGIPGYSHNHGFFVENHLINERKSTVTLEIHPFSTEAWLWEKNTCIQNPEMLGKQNILAYQCISFFIMFECFCHQLSGPFPTPGSSCNLSLDQLVSVLSSRLSRSPFGCS